MIGAKTKGTAKISMRIYKKEYDRWFETPQQLKRYEFWLKLKRIFRRKK